MLLRVSRTYEETHKIIDATVHKLCKDCNDWFPMTEEYYYKNKSSKADGFNPYCKVCTKKRSWKWQKDNWDKMLIHFQKENAKPEKKAIKEISYQKAREKGYYRQYYKDHPEKFKEYAETRSNKKHDISKQEWKDCKNYFNSSCAYCGMTEEEHRKLYKQDLHKEHVDHDGKNDISNCVPSCKICNSKKKIYSFEYWYSNSNDTYTLERYNKIKCWLHSDYLKYILTP